MEEIRLASVLSYRVVCSWDPDCPKRIYVDICRDGFCSHDHLFEMQKKFYHNDKLERIFNDSKGIMLRQSRDGGDIHLFYVKHKDIMAQQRQKKLRELVDGEIIRVFKQMQEQGKLQTICVQLLDFKVDTAKHYAQSAKEEQILELIKKEERLKKLKEIRQAYYAQQKYASCPHVQLMLNQKWQAEY